MSKSLPAYALILFSVYLVVASAPAAAQGDWLTINIRDQGLLVYKFVRSRGDPRWDYSAACASYNGRDCLWNVPKNKIDFSRVRPLVCGQMHRSVWGVTGYEQSSHWCSITQALRSRQPID
jgi:hypothetical protein